ncbi:DMT family transporter [Peribacillus sp. SCS-155]|uniref:DMT family transporter n=1 Tax=Peribacillus sedimenti TaxID=3115297 RepID=UPI0039068441
MKTAALVYTAAIVNASIVGLSFLLTKIALEATSPVDALGYRFFFAWLLLSIYWAFSGKRKISVKEMDKKSLLFLAMLAVFYPIFFFSFQAFGLDYTSSAEGGIILAFSPALTALMAAIFLKEKVNILQIIFISLSISGVIYIFIMNGATFDVSESRFIGIFFLLLSCCSISGYAVLGRYLSITFNPIHLTYIMASFGFLFFNTYAFATNISNGSIRQYLFLWRKEEFLYSVLFLAIFATILTSFLSNYILSVLSASKMGIFSNLSTVISILAGAVFLDEQINMYHVFGSIMIIAGVIGTNLFKEQPNRRKNEGLASGGVPQDVGEPVIPLTEEKGNNRY